jgi:hypothetical protein
VGRLGVEQTDLDGDKVMSVGPRVILQPGEVEGRDFWTYYWPRPDDFPATGTSSVLILDESGSQVIGTVGRPGIDGSGVGIDTKDQLNGRSQRFVVLLAARTIGFAAYQEAYGGNEGIRYALANRPNAFPDNVLGLDGVDVVVWQADEIKPSDLSPDFQLKALLDWVHAGGHLIVSVSSQGQEFSKAEDRLRNAMPMVFTGTRTLTVGQLNGVAGFPQTADLLKRGPDVREKPLIQAIGRLKPGARVGSGGQIGDFKENPLIVTGAYGAGAITVLTINAGIEPLDQVMNDEDWMVFWNQVAGWQGGSGYMMGRETFRVRSKTDAVPPVHLPARELHLGDEFPKLVDVTDVTAVRLLVAVLFLGLYWMAAGPVGHLILRYYRVVHWSWWVFGGTVVIAAAVAGAVVTVLQLTNYDLRHESVVIGTVGSREVTAVGYYGLFAPRSGLVEVSQPDGPGMNYITPLCVPTQLGVKPFADPQSYELWDEKAYTCSPVFRNTLKKMEGRWTGRMPGIDGSASVEGVGSGLRLKGSLTNNSGYALENVEIIVHAPALARSGQGDSYMFNVGKWPAGATIALESLKLELVGKTSNQMMLEAVLGAMARNRSERSMMGGFTDSGSMPGDDELLKGHSQELLYLLLDARKLEPLQETARVEPVRTLARTMDCTKLLHAYGALIVGKSGNFANKDYAKSPVPVSVNGRELAGKGEVMFAWGLPLSGTVQGGGMLPEPEKAAEEAAPAPARPGRRMRVPPPPIR